MVFSESTSPVESQPSDERIIMYSTSWCGDCRRAKRIFGDFNVPYVEVNIEQDEDAAELVQSLNNGMRSVPTILFPDGSVLVEPSNTTLMARLVPFTPPAP
jgi:mycoredoxin